jgi:hypothetical protein
MSKEFWKSKSIWTQIVGMIGMGLALFGVDVLDAEAQAAIVGGIWGVVGIVMRFKTDTPIA